MALNDLMGVDHVVVAVHNLDAAAQAWMKLGFTLSPRGVHSARMGTGNHTIMLGDDYLELFGILVPTEQNVATRDFLSEREGIERVALTSRDASSGADALRARGLAALGPIDFARPVALADGREVEARFSIYQWPHDAAPAGVRLFACQHWTRDAVWIPELQRHANTAHRIVAIEMVSPDPAADSAQLARLIDGDAIAQPDGRYVVASARGRADFVVQTRDMYLSNRPQIAREAVPERGAAGLVLGVKDLAATEHALGASVYRAAAALIVPPNAATGVALVFVVD